jgi:hypothetical protein
MLKVVDLICVDCEAVGRDLGGTKWLKAGWRNFAAYDDEDIRWHCPSCVAAWDAWAEQPDAPLN